MVRLAFLFLCFTPAALAQPKEIRAARTESPPEIDGVLTDSCWQWAPVAEDFMSNEPVFGNAPGEITEVRLLYDDEALYAAYYLFDKEPGKIMKLLSERDKTLLSDELMLGLDTYNDKISAFRFQVSAAGVQSDRYMSPFIPRSDRSWDAVWQSAVTHDEHGWYVEMKIPFTALRFPKKTAQQWGIQFGRYVGRTGEFTTWSPVNPNIGGGPVRQWGVLAGITDIRPPLRLSVWPYLTVGLQRAQSGSSNSPADNTEVYYSGGMDLKYGINQSYTLDMTLVPDFSQVQSDNTILNLTPFEVKYEERRQFFSEGTDMFNKAGIFYSRRIGGVPSGLNTLLSQLQSNETLQKTRSIVRLLNATKVSGRTSNGLGIGVLNAITENTYARVSNELTGESREILTEPFSNFNIVVVDQSLRNNSKVGAINTNVNRKGTGIDANVSALDFILNTRGNLYALNGTAIYSHRKGALLAAPGGKQTGYNYKLDFAKVSRNFRFEVYHAAVSEDYNPNDLGLLTETNFFQDYGALRYFSFKPYRSMLNWSTSLSYAHTATLTNTSFQKSEIELASFFLFKDFSSISFALNSNPHEGHDIYEPRTRGYFFLRPRTVKSSFRYNTDSRRRSQLQLSGAVKSFSYPHEHYQIEVGVSPTIRFGDQLVLNVSSLFYRQQNNQGFAAKPDANTIVFGLRQEHSLENIAQLQYFFSPYSHLNFRVRDYWSRIRYDRYYTLQRDGTLQSFAYGGNTDANLNIFNIDMVYTWQYGPGSFLSLSWKTNMNRNTKSRADGYFESVADAWDGSRFTTVSLRVLYYLDYLKIRRARSRLKAQV
jgi:hypothetical protein